MTFREKKSSDNYTTKVTLYSTDISFAWKGVCFDLEISILLLYLLDYIQTKNIDCEMCLKQFCKTRGKEDRR